MMNLLRITFFTITFFINIFSSLIFASVQVEGVQFGTWTLEDSPVIVKENVIIPKGLVLKIEPGVIVKFLGKYHLKVKGGLIAKGRENNPVIFTSYYDNDLNKNPIHKFILPQELYWGGIEFIDDSDDYVSILDFCEIKYGAWGLRCKSSLPILTNIKIINKNISSLKINDVDHIIQQGKYKNYIAENSRSEIKPLPDPLPESEEKRLARLEFEKQRQLEVVRKQSFEDSLRKTQKLKPVLSKTGKLILDRNDLGTLNAFLYSNVLGLLPGFINVATIWKGSQITSRGLIPSISNSRFSFTLDGIPFYDPVARMSYLELVPIEAMDRIEIYRGFSLTSFNHHGVNGAVDFIPRNCEKTLTSESKLELGAYGTKNLAVLLGVNKDSTIVNISSRFKNNSGYWRNISNDELGNSFKQKYMNELYNFSFSLRKPSLSVFVSYFDLNQDNLGLVPQREFTGQTYQRGLFIAFCKKNRHSPKITSIFQSSFIKTYDKSEVGILGNIDLHEKSSTNYALSKGSVFNASLQYNYQRVNSELNTGYTISRYICNPLYEIKDTINDIRIDEFSSNSLKISGFEQSLFFGITHNFSAFWGFIGKGSFNFHQSALKPYCAVDTKFIFNPFLPIDTYLRYSHANRIATLIEKHINLPGLFQGNKRLKPEKFDQFEWCIDIHPGKDWLIGTLFYYLKSSDLIQLNEYYKFLNNSQIEWTPGCEIVLQGKMGRKSYIMTTFSYTDISKEHENYPKLSINSLINHKWSSNFSTTSIIQYIDEMQTSLKLGPYYIANLIFSYNVFSRIKLSINCFDLFNQQPNNPEYIRGGIPAIPAGSGRSIYFSIAVN